MKNSIENIYKNEKFDFWHKTFKRISKIILLSGLMIASVSKKSQGQTAFIPDSTTMEIKLSNDALNDSLTAETRKLALEQRSWLVDYIKSPKFKERLSKEYLRWQKLNFDPTDNSLRNANVFKKTYFDDNGDTLCVVDPVMGDIDIRASLTNQQLEDFLSLKNVFPDVDLKDLTEEDKKAIDSIINDRLYNVQHQPWIISDAFGVPESFGECFNKLRTDSVAGIPLLSGLIRIDVALPDSATTTPIHEGAHGSTNNKKNINTLSRFLFEDKAHSTNAYLNDATEIMARLYVFRYLLDKYKICDPKTEDFTEDHLEKALNTPEILKQFNIPQLLETLKKAEIYWFMNNTAFIPLPTYSKDTYDILKQGIA